MTLMEFLLARIAEDETRARDGGADAMTGFRWKHYPEDAYNEIQSLMLAHSRSVLAECEAKRRIVAMATGLDEGVEQETVREALEHLALPYAGHPDYDEAWRP